MSSNALTRRSLLAGTAATAAGASLIARPAQAAHHKKSPAGNFRYCLNMSTIRGQKLAADAEVDVAGQAGYDAIEPWLGNLHKYVEGGGKLKDLKKKIEDHGMTVESAIGFANWVVDDDARRAKGLEDAKRDMDLLAEIGGKRIAAPPAGANAPIDVMVIAERYAKLLEIGDQTGVTPQIEMWGGHKTIGRVSTAICAAIEAGHPKACFLGDVFHTYKGGCDFNGLLLLGPQALQCFHFNDYPADPPQHEIKDSHRVYTGDGIAPIGELLRGFAANGAFPALSLELFNKEIWKRPALDAAKTGLEKMKAEVKKAFA